MMGFTRARITLVSNTIPSVPTTISSCYLAQTKHSGNVLRDCIANPIMPRWIYISAREIKSVLKNPIQYDFLIFKLQSTPKKSAMPL